jgi:outer membrane protein OmpA-like peptidoglycan-associated protein
MSQALTTGFDRRRGLMVGCLVLGALDLAFIDGVALPRVMGGRSIGRSSGEGRPPPAPPALHPGGEPAVLGRPLAEKSGLLPRAGGEVGRGRPSPANRPLAPTIVPTAVLELTIHFTPADASLGARVVAAVDALAARAADHPGWTFLLHGHADARGDEAFNARLSELRAATVAAHLEAAGVPAARLRTAAFGATRPLAAGDDPRSRRLNRRVEIFIVRGGS